MRTGIVLSSLLVVASVLACASESLAPEEPPDVQGVIVDVMPDYRVLVKSSVVLDAYPDTFFVNPRSDTRILIRQGDGIYRKGAITDLAEGDTIRAWLSGEELRSLPPQYPALMVELRKSTAD